MTRAPSEELTHFLHGADPIVESGSVGNPLPAAFGRILDSRGHAARSWFIYSPRPDVDWTTLNALWTGRGYRTERLGAGSVRYRKPLAAQERADMVRIVRGLGKPVEAVMRDGYLLVDVTLARPEADSGNPPIAQLRGSCD